MKNKFILLLGSIIFVGLSVVLYLQVPTSTHAHCDYDSVSYIQRALVFYKDSSFAGLGAFPNLFVLGYAFFIGLCFKMFGIHNNAVVLIQIILALLCGFLMFVIARRLFNETVAQITFLFFSFNLGFLIFAQFVLAEIPMIFLLLLFVERLSAYWGDGRLLQLMLAGLSLGLSVLIKPVAFYFVFFLVPLFFCGKHALWRKKISQALLFLVCFYVPIVGYMIHNKIVFNEFQLSDTTTVNLYHHFFSRVLMRLHHINMPMGKKMIGQIEHEKGMLGVKDFFLTTVISHPVVALSEWGINVFKTFAGLYVTNLKVLVNEKVRGGDVSYFKMTGSLIMRGVSYIMAGAHRTWIKIVGIFEVGWSLCRYILCCIGIWYLIRRRCWWMFYFFSSYIFYFSMITGFDGCARYRMFFEFILIMLAALGMWVIMQRNKGLDNEASLCSNFGRW